MAQENPSIPRPTIAGRKWRSNTLSEYFADRGHIVTRWRSSFSHQKKYYLIKNHLEKNMIIIFINL